MIINTKTGIFVEGEIAKPPEFKTISQNNVLMTLNVRYDSEKNDNGKWLGKFIDVKVWHVDEDAWTGMLEKGDHVIAVAKEVKKRDYNGKTYYSIDANDVFPSGNVVMKWLQQAINMMWSSEGTAPQEPQEQPQAQSWPTATTEQPTAAPPSAPSSSPNFTEDEMRIIESDEDDLPF